MCYIYGNFSFAKVSATGVSDWKMLELGICLTPRSWLGTYTCLFKDNGIIADNASENVHNSH